MYVVADFFISLRFLKNKHLIDNKMHTIEEANTVISIVESSSIYFIQLLIVSISIILNITKHNTTEITKTRKEYKIKTNFSNIFI